MAQDKKKAFICEYWQERAAGFAALRQKELHSVKYTLWQEELYSHLPVEKRLRILDIGCGPGFFSIMLAKTGHEVTGIDVTAEMIKEACALAQAEGVEPLFQVMDAEHTSFPSACFDVAVSRNVVWNLPHPDLAYLEWLRILKPGGMLLTYDAEYAKTSEPKTMQHAHADISPELLRRCQTMYDFLDISSYERPQWDEKVLLASGSVECVTIDRNAGNRLYGDVDPFYITAPLFLVKAIKK